MYRPTKAVRRPENGGERSFESPVGVQRPCTFHPPSCTAIRGSTKRAQQTSLRGDGAMSTSIPSIERPELPKRIITLAFQFDELRRRNLDCFRPHITQLLRPSIEAIVSSFDPPKDIPRGHQLIVRRGRSASATGSPIPLNIDPVTFPEAWLSGDSTRSLLP